jgi:hypothetical protein
MTLSSSIRKIVLIKSIDWDTWISYVKIRASNFGIWELINPNNITLSTHLIESIQSKFESSIDSAQLDMLAYELYRQQIQVYESQLEKYETQQRAFVALASYIQNTISVYIQKAERHSEHQLRALKTRLASTNNARALKIERRATYINAQSSKVEGVKIQDDAYKQTSLAYTSEGVGELASERFRHFRDNQRHRHSNWGDQDIRGFDKGIKWCLHQENVSD